MVSLEYGSHDVILIPSIIAPPETEIKLGSLSPLFIIFNHEEFVNYFDKVIIPIALDLDINNNISITSVPFIRNDCIDYDHRSNMITVDCNSNSLLNGSQ